jgi:hypothetical protein
LIASTKNSEVKRKQNDRGLEFVTQLTQAWTSS